MKLRHAVKKVLGKFGITKLRDAQISPIHYILDNKDTIVVAPTGLGKSLIYQIPAVLHQEHPTLVIEPTLALMHDQVKKLKDLEIAAEYIDATITKKERKVILKRFSNGKVNILYLTPEQLQSADFLCSLKNIQLFMVVVDECHCVLDWGYTFRKAYLRIGAFVDALPHGPVIVALTATASQGDAYEIGQHLHMYAPKIFTNNLYRKNLKFLKRYAQDRHAKHKYLLKYLKKYHRRSTVIYCNTKTAVQGVYELLQEKYPDQVARCHANLPTKERTAHELKFLHGERKIMVATSAFGMGIDLGAIDLVIHFNMPLSLTDYIQQSGRAGRDGQTAHCILLYNEECPGIVKL